MSQHDNIFSVKLIKKNGKLVHVSPATLGLQLDFVSNLEEGQEVSVFFEAFKDDGTNAQLAMIHVCIRKLASEIGDTFDEMKKTIKRDAGLSWMGTKDRIEPLEHFKSFADCSKEELALVIESLNKAGEMVNISF